jgi:hypothetical protein
MGWLQNTARMAVDIGLAKAERTKPVQLPSDSVLLSNRACIGNSDAYLTSIGYSLDSTLFDLNGRPTTSGPPPPTNDGGADHRQLHQFHRHRDIASTTRLAWPLPKLTLMFSSQSHL